MKREIVNLMVLFLFSTLLFGANNSNKNSQRVVQKSKKVKQESQEDKQIREFEAKQQEIKKYKINLKDEIFNPFIELVFKSKIELKDEKKEAEEHKKKEKPIRSVLQRKERGIKLLQVFNNKVLLLIGGSEKKWVKLGEKVEGYLLSKIDNRFIVLAKKEKLKVIKLGGEKKFNIKVKR